MSDDDDKKVAVGRIAMRVSEDGNWWIGYYAEAETMDGALEMARIRMVLVQDEGRRQRFLDLMRDSLTAMLNEFFGTDTKPEFHTKVAPEHERKR